MYDGAQQISTRCPSLYDGNSLMWVNNVMLLVMFSYNVIRNNKYSNDGYFLFLLEGNNNSMSWGGGIVDDIHTHRSCVYYSKRYLLQNDLLRDLLIRRKPSANSSSYFSSSIFHLLLLHNTKWIFCLFLPFLLHLSFDFAWLRLTEHFSTQMTH